MPSTATITAFYSFTANTKARASLVNANFDVLRGHMLPLNVNTATAADNLWDLGSAEYRWRNLYCYDIEIGNTSGSVATMRADGATTASEIIFELNGVTKARINTNGIGLSSIPFEYTFGAHIISLGFETTIYSEIATLAASIIGNGRPIEIGFANAGDNSAGEASGISFSVDGTTGTYGGYIKIARDTSTAIVFEQRLWATGNASGTDRKQYSSFRFYDFSAPSGSVTYKVYASSDNIAVSSFALYNLKMFAKRT